VSKSGKFQVYFFGSSTSPEMQKEDLSDMLEYYHRRLTLHLSKLGYSESLYPFESLKKDVDDCSAFGYITGTFLAQVKNIFMQWLRKRGHSNNM
jgi:hypothetical protein